MFLAHLSNVCSLIGAVRVVLAMASSPEPSTSLHVSDCLICEGNEAHEEHPYTPPSQANAYDHEIDVEEVSEEEVIFEKTIKQEPEQKPAFKVPRTPFKKGKRKASEDKFINVVFNSDKRLRVTVSQKNCKMIRKSRVYISRNHSGSFNHYLRILL